MAAQLDVPNLVYIGGPKCASTWIFHSLKDHPQAYVPPAKEIFFFNKQYHRGIDWYRSFFAPAGPQHLCVADISPSYLYCEEAAHRIRETLPSAKLIASLRNPIWRAWSMYLFKKRNGKTSSDFRGALVEDPKLLEWGLYARHVARYQELFGEERFKVFIYDDLQLDALQFGRSLYTFLGIDPSFENPVAEQTILKASKPRSKVGASVAKKAARLVKNLGFSNLVGRVKRMGLLHRVLYKPMEEGIKEEFPLDEWDRLANYFAEDVEHISTLLDRDLHHWLKKPEEGREQRVESREQEEQSAEMEDQGIEVDI